MDVKRYDIDKATFEYGCDLSRLYPWDVVDTEGWGTAIASVRPYEFTTPHAHDEHETFVVMQGEGLMRIESEERVLKFGDTVYIPKMAEHSIINRTDKPLVFLTIYWD